MVDFYDGRYTSRQKRGRLVSSQTDHIVWTEEKGAADSI